MIHRYIIEATDEVNGFEEAIEKLDREWGIEELEPCDDAISRQAVNELQKYRYNCGDTGITCASLSSINNLPSVAPQPKTGHWIFKDEDEQACLIYTCDKCGEQITILDDTIKSPQEGHYNFCPNCGAKMEVEEK